MKRNIIQLVCIAFVSILFSILLEVFVFNFNILKLDKSERKFTLINPTELVSEGFSLGEDKIKCENGCIISLNDNTTYINKLYIYFNSDSDFNAHINFNSDNVYGKLESKTIDVTNSYKLGVSIENINDDVSNLNIVIDKENVDIISIGINNEFNIDIYRIVFFSLSILGLLMLIIYRNIFLSKLEYKFLLIALISGFLMIFIIPNTTFYCWDDETHFTRVMTDTKINTTLSDSENQMSYALPFAFNTITSEEEIQVQNNYLNVNDNNKIISSYRHLSGISSISYIVTSGIYNGLSLILVPFTLRFKITKFVNLLIYIIICFFTIRDIKLLKRLTFILTLIPTSIFLASNFSYDFLLTACTLFCFSKIINMMTSDDKKIKFKDTIPFLTISFVGIAVKAVYAPILLLIFLIPSKKFNSKKDNKYFKLSIIGICLLLLASIVLPMLLKPVANDLRGGSNVNTVQQIILILKHPFAYISVLYNNAFLLLSDRLFSINILMNYAYVGLGSNNLYILFLLLLLFVTFTDTYDRKKTDFSKLFKVACIIIVIIITVLIWTALYVSFTELGQLTIAGVQQRYFIPLLFPILLCLNTYYIKNNIDKNKYDFIISMVSYLILIISIYENMLFPLAF